jgi:hypothetical protein
LCGNLYGLALLLGELVLEPLLFGSCRLMDLLELLLKVDNLLFFLRRVLQQVSPALGLFCYGLSQYIKLVSRISTRHHQEKYIVRKLTVSALLIVTMLVYKACITSFSSKISSCQGVPF